MRAQVPGWAADVLGPRARGLMRGIKRRRRPIRLGSFESTAPISGAWGWDRGRPVDRWYIERFLKAHREDITGRVLEVKDSEYTDRYGHDLLERAVLDVDPTNEGATHIADLAAADSLPDGGFDCFVLTQTLQYIFDLRAALEHTHRVLRPGGVLLATLPVASRIDGQLTDYWRFTPRAASGLLEEVFGPGGAVTVSGHGNVLAQIAFLEGLAVEDLSESQLEVDDDRFPLIVCARAVRAV